MTTLNDILLAAENLVSQIQQYQSEQTTTTTVSPGTHYVSPIVVNPQYTTPTEPPKEEETVTEEVAPTEEVDTLESRLAKLAEETKQATDPLA